MNRTVRLPVLTVAVALLASACTLFDGSPDPHAAAEAFAADLRDGRITASSLRQPARADVAVGQLDHAVAELGVRPRVSVVGAVRPDETQRPDAATSAAARAHLRVSWPLPTGSWGYDSWLPLVLIDDRWRIDWHPTILHPRLARGRELELRATAPRRGPILSADGTPLFARRPVVTVYVQPARMRSARQVTAAVQRHLGIDPGPLRDRIAAADPDHLVEVVTLRMDDYAPLRSTLQPVPGLVFRRDDLPLTPTRAFARAVLGRLGAPTAEVLDEAGFGFDADDVLGLSGLQRRFQRELAGTPGVEVLVVDADGAVVERVHRRAPVAGAALRTTLDVAVQRAADAALAPVDRAAALVALRPSSGEVLAVAHSPDGGAQNLAFTGRYPPGSTFKIVTAAALLDQGWRAAGPVRCPPSVTIGGRRFANADAGGLGATTFTRAFARSCNTTFAAAADDVAPERLAAAASAFGFGTAWDPGVAAYRGQVPTDGDPVARAAAMIGQGEVLASPLLMASVAGAVQDGRWRPPVLLPDHARVGDVPSGPAPGVVAQLRRMMRAAVAHGTARRLADVPGPPVLAKTGSAEQGALRTHAWVVVAQGDLAAAVLVEGGGRGGAVAAPIAERFLRRR